MQIEALSWTHNTAGNGFALVTETFAGGQRERPGLVIGFTDRVRSDEIDPEHIFQVLLEHQELAQELDLLVFCLCRLAGETVPVEVTQMDAQGRITAAQQVPPPSRAVAFLMDFGVADRLRRLQVELWVRLRGDFVLDTTGRAIDAEFARGQLPSGDRPAGSPAGAQGGLFESWFRLGFQEGPVLVNVNRAAVDELRTLSGVGAATANRIVAEREARPFESPEDFRARARISESVWNRIRDLVVVS